MQETFNIEMDDEKVKHFPAPPKSLSENCFLYADTWGVIDPRADLLIQKRTVSSCSVWRFAFFVKQRTKLFFHQPVEKMFMFFNKGLDIEMQISEQPRNLFKQNQFNVYYLPEFIMTAYPKPNRKRFELILMEMGNGDHHKMEEILMKSMASMK